MTFSGVLLADLLEVAQVPPAATSIHMLALDDFTAVLPVPALRTEPVLLALAQDGGPIPIDKGGPTRIVFGRGSTLAENTDNWIWSLKDMDVR